MKRLLKDYFNFGKSERNAIFIIVILLLFIVLLPAVFRSLKDPEVSNSDSFSDEIAAFMKVDEKLSARDQHDFDFDRPDKAVARARYTPFDFDPNTLDEPGWRRLGFSAKQAAGIIKYRIKGGKFRKNEDLKNLYAVTDETYEILEPYIKIEPSASSSENVFKSSEAKSGRKPYDVYQAELNSADSANLVKVRGIGPAFARRIIRYREKLGGFARKEQLLEVYGMDSTKYAMISPGVFTDETLITKLHINSASLEQLRAHPYIDYYIAKAIVDTRIQRGAFSSADGLKSIPLIYEDIFYKLLPYISLN